MANFGAKTPISYLQEYLVKQKMSALYELIRNGVGVHNPEFVFRVKVGNLSEEGSGRSKQEAKHRAAEKMLKALKVPEFNIEEEEINEFNEQSSENYVGQLKDYCILQRYPAPTYYLEEAAGPSHSRIFKMICCVSQLKSFGISRTKKQAKHKSAFKMLQLLKEVGIKKTEEGLPQSETLDKDPHKTIMSPLTDEEIMEKYNALRSVRASTYTDPAAHYKDHYKAYIDLQETSPTLMKLINEGKITDNGNSLTILQEIIKELKVTLNTTTIASKEKNDNYILMTMTIFPPLAAIGVSEENSAFNLLNTLLVLCKE